MTASTLKSNPAFTLTTPSDREIIMTRVFDAPRRLVFEAWTKPEHLVNWFGQRGWTLPVCEVDLRVGGAWGFVMRRRSRKEVGMGGVYQEIAPYERLVYKESFDDYPGESPNAMTFSEKNGKSPLTPRVL